MRLISLYFVKTGWMGSNPCDSKESKKDIRLIPEYANQRKIWRKKVKRPHGSG